MYIATIDLYYIMFEDVKFDKYDPANIVFARLIFVRCKQRKLCKKDRQRIDTYSIVSNKSVGLVHDKK